MLFDFKKNKRNASKKFELESDVIGALSGIAPALCSPPSLRKAKRVLFVQPHPDDNQIAAGGTIAWLISRGVECWELTVTDDRYASPEYIGKENEVETCRQKEAKAAQQFLGMKNAGFLGFADKNTASVHEISRKICEVIREIKPDFVITADPSLVNECHSDHIKVGMAVKFACMDAECKFYPEFDNGQFRSDAYKVPNIGFYYTDKPNTIIDISDFEETKIKAMECHVSQCDPLLKAVVRLEEQYYAKGTRYKAVEHFRLQSSLQMHCFDLPIE